MTVQSHARKEPLAQRQVEVGEALVEAMEEDLVHLVGAVLVGELLTEAGHHVAQLGVRPGAHSPGALQFPFSIDIPISYTSLTIMVIFSPT